MEITEEKVIEELKNLEKGHRIYLKEVTDFDEGEIEDVIQSYRAGAYDMWQLFLEWKSQL